MPSAEDFSVPADAVEFCLCECMCVKELNKTLRNLWYIVCWCWQLWKKTINHQVYVYECVVVVVVVVVGLGFNLNTVT